MAFHRAGRERVHAYPVDGAYLFRHYFEGEAVFAELREYYDHGSYRFEVPPDEFEAVREFLSERGYALVPVEDVAAFVVSVEQYTAHPEDIFSESVAVRAGGGYNHFLLTDGDAVERAVREGASRVADVDAGCPF